MLLIMTTYSLPRRDLCPPGPKWPIQDARGTVVRQPNVITYGPSRGNALLEFRRYSGADDQVIGVEFTADDLDRYIAGLEDLRRRLQLVAGWDDEDDTLAVSEPTA